MDGTRTICKRFVNPKKVLPGLSGRVPIDTYSYPLLPNTSAYYRDIIIIAKVYINAHLRIGGRFYLEAKRLRSCYVFIFSWQGR